MPVSPYTNEFMRALPAALRPNPYGVDEYVMEAVENGWTVHALAEACYRNDRSPNPAFVATNIKHLCKHPPTQTSAPTGWKYGHVTCDTHRDCELCRCSPTEVVHHQPIPMPPEFRTAWRQHFTGWGVVE